jgi:hypothetical protein
LEHPHDYLGTFVAEQKAGGWNPTGFYPTPHEIVELMVQMLMHDADKDDRDPRIRSVCDPCAGSGRMLLNASNKSLTLFGQDIDPLAVAMCKINGALYAPWLSFPLPAAIVGTQVPSPPAPLPVLDPPRPKTRRSSGSMIGGRSCFSSCDLRHSHLSSFANLTPKVFWADLHGVGAGIETLLPFGPSIART